MEGKRQRSTIGGLPDTKRSNVKIELLATQKRILIPAVIFFLFVGIIIWILHSNSQFVSKETSQETWSQSIAALSVDRLVEHGLVKEEDSERGVRIVSKEILVRLSMGDVPPSKSKD